MITDLTEEDIEQVLLLSDTSFGAKFQTYSTLQTYISDTRKILKVYKINGELAGFSKGMMLTKDQCKNTLLKTNARIDNELKGEGNVGFLETTCVKPEYRRTGIARKLFDQRLHSLKQMGKMDFFCSTLWEHTEGANARKLFESAGFRQITIVPGYWHHDSIQKHYTCPKCGTPPCTCAMRFYKL